MQEILSKIATEVLGLETLEPGKIQQALEAAYRAGQQAQPEPQLKRYQCADPFGNMHCIVVKGESVRAHTGGGTPECLGNFTYSMKRGGNNVAAIEMAALKGAKALTRVTNIEWTEVR